MGYTTETGGKDMNKGDVITVEGLDWYQQSPNLYLHCRGHKGVHALVARSADGGWWVSGCLAGAEAEDATPSLFPEENRWFVTRDDAMKAVAAWIVTLRLQGKIKEKEDED